MPHTGLLVNLSSTVVAVVVSERALLATAVEEQHSLFTGTIVTSSITRDVIALTPTLVLNVSMTPHPQAPVMRPWAVSNITLASGTQLRWTSMTDAPWVTLLAIEPPLEGGGRAWICSQTQLLTSVTISLRIYFTCEGQIPALMLDVNIPAPGVARDLAAQVEAVGQYSQIVSILAGGASSGSALGRVMATREYGGVRRGFCSWRWCHWFRSENVRR
ncbi:Hypothetical protein, putative [Bodo saltans]|uniref:GPI-anchored surface protein n=1 Tax=Bodo saltans TaxID=75058 RepID=A0A0S4J2M2_BODSA|nr:Hypothetical protein, putative [Bodo saltans]|eukprot:CUG85153.1 Hypothetical protein, putative [Bodo saltans]